MAKKNDKPLPLRTFDLIKENLLRQDLFVPIFALGSAIRIFFVLEADFPLNDGGLFYKMTQELVENNFRLPLFTSYNHASIPFAYPPLGFYVAGILTKLFNISLINIFRFLPLAVSILTIYAFYILVKELFPLKTALLSTFIFVLLPRSFMWQIMGGGVARSLGLFFSLLTLINAAAYFKSRSNKHLYLGITFMTLTTLSHLEWLFFTLYSLVIINAHIKRGLKSFKNILLIIFVTTLLTFPWWFTITKRFGFTPFSNFLRAGSVYKDFATYPHLMTLSFTDEPFLSILGTLGLMGLFISVFRGNLFLLAWFITPLLLAPRSSPNLTVIPLSVAASITINQFFLLLRNGKFGDSRNLEGEKSKNKIYGSISRILILYGGVYLIFSTVSLSFMDQGSYFNFISKSQLQAMDWISKNTGAPNKFLLITEGEMWGMDAVLEWFPALADRESITTPQGHEWLPNDEFYLRVKLYNDLKRCYFEGIDCIEEVVDREKQEYSYVYIYKPEIDSLEDYGALVRYQLNNSANYDLVYEGTEALIFKRKI